MSGEERRARYEEFAQTMASYHPDHREHREAAARLQGAIAADQVESAERIAQAANRHASALATAT